VLEKSKMRTATTPVAQVADAREEQPGKGWQSLPSRDLEIAALNPTPAPNQRRLVTACVPRQCTRDKGLPLTPPALDQ